MMRAYLSFLPALVLFTTSLLADDTFTAASLEALGGKVTLKEEVVTEVAFKDSAKIGDAELAAIGKLSGLKSLTLYGKCRGLNDATVGHLKALSRLEALHTEGAELSDAGLEGLAALGNLQAVSFFHLSLANKSFTGKGLVHLKKCPKLQRLTVAGIFMGDEGFAAISEMVQLRDLRTWHTYQTQAANGMIAKLPNLVSLQMGQRLPQREKKPVSFDNETLKVYATMTTLEKLDLSEADLTLDGLRELKKLPRLKSLVLHDMEFAAADLEQLRSEMPTVKIEFLPMTDEQREKLKKYLE